MTKITQGNNVYAYSQMQQAPQNNQYYVSAPQLTMNDEFVTQHKKNGLIERLYNGLKNLTGLGMGSKKVQKNIEKAENGEISEEEARASIEKYGKSQANSVQIAGDALSIGASAATFFTLRKFLKKNVAKIEVNSNSKTNVLTELFGKSLGKKIANLLKSNKKLIGFSAVSAALVGGVVKKWALKFDRIGSKEYKVDKKDFNNLATEQDESAYKLAKKDKRRARRKANRRNFFSGAINGIMMPLVTVGGAVIGAPLYLAGNIVNRYFIGNTAERNKSFGSFVDNIKNDGILHGALAVGMAIPLIKKGKWASVFDKNIEKSVNKLKDAKLTKSYDSNESVYNQLDEILRNDNTIRSIMNDSTNVGDKIKKLTDENIFAVKFKQITNDGSEICRALKEECPPSRTLEEAKNVINDNFGNKYEVKQLLGVGTVAETYLAKGKDGKDVCIKILKDGITEEKISKDKTKFENIIESLENKSNEEKDYLKRNLNDLYESIVKEVDLKNEKIAAEELIKHTSVAKVAKPIEVVNNMYVMEKAEGISLESLVKLNSAQNVKDLINKGVSVDECTYYVSDDIKRLLEDKRGTALQKDDAIKSLEKYIEKVQSRTPQYGDIKLTKADVKALIEEYQQVLVEQFNKVDKNGKVLHGDIHTGNIFIDVNALKQRKGNALTDTATMLTGKRKNNQIFTLIDTGNTINMSQEQALRSIGLTSYIKRGNVHDIADYVLDGAILPQGMSKENATKIISEKLQKVFFDNETACEKVTNESLINLTTNIMRENGIIPADTALNLNKARTSANTSLSGLYKSMFEFYIGDILNATSNLSISKIISISGDVAKDVLLLQRKNTAMQSAQEKLNLRHMTSEMRKHYKKNPNNLPTNSEDLLTYELKQSMRINDKLPTF